MMPTRDSTGPAFLVVVIVAILVLGLVAFAVLQVLNTGEGEQEEPGLPIPTIILPTETGGTQYPNLSPEFARVV
ncbi:MAG: hypothetical protein ACRDG5_08150 [Anaerolineales bacterium]